MSSADARRLHVARFGSSGPAIVLLHGFTQTHVSWRPVIDRLEGRYQIFAVDLPGHGGSTSVAADLAGTADLVASAVAGEPVALVGYSLGGRVALRTALDHPDLVASLVLIGATAGIDDPVERAARRRADEALASEVASSGVEAFVRRWIDQPLFDGLVPAPEDLEARIANDASGLSASLRTSGTGTMDPPWWDELPTIAAPTWVVWGERDRKFADLGARLAAAIGGPTVSVEVPDVGHAAHLQRPDLVAEVIERAARPPS